MLRPHRVVHQRVFQRPALEVSGDDAQRLVDVSQAKQVPV
jgi:hypothetical protein